MCLLECSVAVGSLALPSLDSTQSSVELHIHKVKISSSIFFFNYFNAARGLNKVPSSLYFLMCLLAESITPSL